MSWQPTLKAMWSPVGQQVMIPTPGQTNKRFGIGAVNCHTGETAVIVRKRKRREQIAELMIELLAKHPTQTVYVAWNNAAVHLHQSHSEKKMKKVALITGGRSGIGFELTKMLLTEGWKVISMDRSAFAVEEPAIKEAFSTGSLIQYRTDLSDFTKLRNTLRELSMNEAYIDVIFNNAGSMSGELQFSVQGREIDYEVNTVAPYIVTRYLTPLLKRGRLKTVVNTSSNAALQARSFDPHQLGNPPRFVKLFGSYAASKLALSLWTKELAPLLLKDDIRIRSVDPGPSKTPMSLSSGMPWFVRLVRPFVFAEPRKGAQNLYDAAFGKYRSDTGNFILKGKDTPLEATNSAGMILAKLEAVFLETVDGK